MNKIIDLRSSGFDVANVQMTRRSMTRMAYLHGLIRAGVCDYIRERLKTLLIERGIVAVDPELELRAQRLERMDVTEAAYLLSGVAARCDYIISLPYSEPIETNGLTDSTTHQLRQLGMTTYLWPDYGPGGPSMNPAFLDPREAEALNRISLWQPDPIGFAGVLSDGPHCVVNQAGPAEPMPNRSPVGNTRSAADFDRSERIRRHRQEMSRRVQDGPAGQGEMPEKKVENRAGFGESRQAG